MLENHIPKDADLMNWQLALSGCCPNPTSAHRFGGVELPIFSETFILLTIFCTH